MEEGRGREGLRGGERAAELVVELDPALVGAQRAVRLRQLVLARQVLAQRQQGHGLEQLPALRGRAAAAEPQVVAGRAINKQIYDSLLKPLGLDKLLVR